jgi:DNA-binding transcriptional ArsR family regulator
MNAETRARRPVPAREQVDLAVEVFRMLSDATRVQLLWAMLDGEMSVNDLAEAVGKPAPGVSQHLAKLRMARLVSTRRQANQVFYRIESEHVRQLVADAIYQAEHAAGGIPEHHRTDSSIREIRDPDADELTRRPRRSGTGPGGSARQR